MYMCTLIYSTPFTQAVPLSKAAILAAMDLLAYYSTMLTKVAA